MDSEPPQQLAPRRKQRIVAHRAKDRIVDWAQQLHSDLTEVHNWLKTKTLSCNTSKTCCITFGSRQNLANAKFMNLELDNRPIEHKPSTKLLGVHIDEMLSLHNQIKHTSWPQWTN